MRTSRGPYLLLLAMWPWTRSNFLVTLLASERPRFLGSEECPESISPCFRSVMSRLCCPSDQTSVHLKEHQGCCGITGSHGTGLEELTALLEEVTSRQTKQRSEDTCLRKCWYASSQGATESREQGISRKADFPSDVLWILTAHLLGIFLVPNGF